MSIIFKIFNCLNAIIILIYTIVVFFSYAPVYMLTFGMSDIKVGIVTSIYMFSQMILSIVLSLLGILATALFYRRSPGTEVHI